MHLLTWDFVKQHGVGKKVRPKMHIRLQRDATATAYAILSHRWGKDEDEVSYDDMTSGDPTSKKGYSKLLQCCKQAQSEGLGYVWVDTCCIDKRSSAELSEAITSMYTYYERSTVCYTYLDDVSIDSEINETFLSSSFSKSLWFTRGWTLQELIAPKALKFFDQSWKLIGAKTGALISQAIEKITNIDAVVLNVTSAIKLASVAKKMSWAVGRTTKRVEDRAYSLMGLFSVYMAPMYGEGTHAFIRLQQAILQTSNDHSIFAWTSPPSDTFSGGFEQVSTMLALSPDQFQDSQNFKPLARTSPIHVEGGPNKFDYALTNAGLSIRLPILPVKEIAGLYAAFLSCTEGESDYPSAVLLRTTSRTSHNHFWRTNSNEGPIERRSRPWFPAKGREDIVTRDIYVMPRFTSLSEDTIEPIWDKSLIGTSSPASAMMNDDIACRFNQDIIQALRHVPDPSYEQLVSLQQIRHLMMTNKSSKLLSTIQRWPKTSTSLPPRRLRFFGHSAQLQQLRSIFTSWTTLSDDSRASQRQTCPSCVLSGLSGLGKTQLALEFCYIAQESQLVDLVLWIPAASRENVIESYRKIAMELGLATLDTPENTVVRKFIDWLSESSEKYWVEGMMEPRSRRWLLVFDNAVEADELDDFWPRGGPGSVLVTSRNPTSWGTHFESECITLEPLSIEESVGYLRSLLGDGRIDCTKLASRLGGSPKTLARVGEHISRSGVSVDQYVRALDENSEPLARKRDFSREQPSARNDLESSWHEAFENLSAAGLAVLRVASLLSADFIPDSILSPCYNPPLESYPSSTMVLFDARGELMSRSLIQRIRAPDAVMLHQMIQSFVISKMEPDVFSRTLATAISLVHSAWNPGQRHYQPRFRASSNVYLPHVNSLKSHWHRLKGSEATIVTKNNLSELLSYAEKLEPTS